MPSEGRQDPMRQVFLDFSGLSFIDRTGISVLIAAQKRLMTRGARLVVRSPRPNVSRMIETTHLREFLKVDNGTAEARTAPDPSRSSI